MQDAETIDRAVRTQKRTGLMSPSGAPEIESILRQHPAVQDVVVLRGDDVSGHDQLVAYVVAKKQYAPVVAGYPRYVLPNNLAVVYQNQYEVDALYREIYENQAYLKLGAVIEDGDCIIDVGANIGMFTLFAQQICTGTRVYALEPAPQLFNLLRINADLYCSNVQLFNCGLSSEAKTATFTFYPHLCGSSGYYPLTQQEAHEELQAFKQIAQERALDEQADEALAYLLKSEVYTTQLKTLSDVLRECSVERVDLLKIDAEKSELDILLGIQKSDYKKIRQIVIEVHSEKLLEQISSLLQGEGYDLVVDRRQTGHDYTHCTTQYPYMLYAIQRRGENNSPDEKQPSFRQTLPTAKERLLSNNELCEFLKNNLPDSIMPSHFEIVETLPQAFIASSHAPVVFEHATRRVDDSLAAPRTPTEKWLAETWSEFLGSEPVDIYTDFFELGGDSLAALRILSRVRETFEVSVPPTVLFAIDFTVAEIAKIIDQYQIEKADVEDVEGMLAELEGLSDEEARALLAGEELE
jgi:FkbM family methyltransferase